MPMTLNKRCTTAARLAVRLVPTAASRQVTQVPIFWPNRMNSEVFRPTAPASSQRLQNADAGRAALQKGRHQRTHQYAHHRVGGVDHHILKALPVPQRFHGGGHHVHAQKQHAQAHGDLSAQLDGGAIARQLQHRAHGGEDNGEVDLHRQHQRGNGGADVRAHDDADGLT